MYDNDVNRCQNCQTVPGFQACKVCCCVVTDLAEVRLGEPGEDDGEQPQQEGEDGGEEEAPPLPLHQTLLVVDQRNALATVCFTTLHTLCSGATYIGGEGLNIVPHLHREECLYTSLST